MPFDPLPPVEPATHMPLEMNEVFIALNNQKLIHTYDTLHKLPTGQTNDSIKLSLENMSPADILQLEQNLMSILELTPEKVIKLPQNDIFYKSIMQHIGCSKYDSYFRDVTGIIHKKVIDFNSTFSAIVIPQILIKYLLHALRLIRKHWSHKILKWLYYF